MPLYVTGDTIEEFQAHPGPVALAHVVNLQGVMGAGIARSIARRWPHVEKTYQEQLRAGRMEWGQCQVVGVDRAHWVLNLFALELGAKFPVSMPHLEMAIREASQWARSMGAVVLCPRLGAGLGRVPWADIASVLPDDWVVFTLRSELHRFDPIAPAVEAAARASLARIRAGGAVQVVADF